MGAFLFKIFTEFIRWLPRKAALRFGAALGSFVYSLAEMTKFKGAIRRNIQTAFGNRFSDEEVARMARQHGRDLLTTYIEAMRMSELPELYEQGLIQVEGLEHLAEAKKEGRGAVLFSAHLGNYELMIAFTGYLGYPAHCVGVKQSTEWFDEFIVRERERFGSKMVYFQDFNSTRAGEILNQNGFNSACSGSP